MKGQSHHLGVRISAGGVKEAFAVFGTATFPHLTVKH